MDKTKIEWADMTWNPVTGCKHNCEYCYAKKIAERFGGHTIFGEKSTDNPFGNTTALVEPLKTTDKHGNTVNAPYPFGFEPTFHKYRLAEPARKQRKRNIFVGSMCDLFGSWVPTKWIVEVLDACSRAGWHNYLFLTKNPQRYIELDELALLPREDNFWYGTTINRVNDPYFTSEHHKTFVSIEPIMEDLAPTLNYTDLDWVIVGAETGNRANKVVPEQSWVDNIVKSCVMADVPVFLKDNLNVTWLFDCLVQLYPRELEKQEV